jgi:hypothetical protein
MGGHLVLLGSLKKRQEPGSVVWWIGEKAALRELAKNRGSAKASGTVAKPS